MGRCIVRTNVEVEDSVLENARRLAKAKTKRETIDIALREYVVNHTRKDFRDLVGEVEFWEGYDYKTMREG
jgi:Arc/MetJ family transcription regulator